jgi:hypothetical protein
MANSSHTLRPITVESLWSSPSREARLGGDMMSPRVTPSALSTVVDRSLFFPELGIGGTSPQSKPKAPCMWNAYAEPSVCLFNQLSPRRSTSGKSVSPLKSRERFGHKSPRGANNLKSPRSSMQGVIISNSQVRQWWW